MGVFEPKWEPQLRARARAAIATADAAHDEQHIARVVATARRLAEAEGADPAIVIPAAWLHDCVTVAKDSPQRSQASRLAAAAATEYLSGIGYPAETLPGIAHAVEAHSFSAGIPPRTIEARVVQDADRLDALGAVGIARTIALGGARGSRLYATEEPFPIMRQPDDRTSVIDHFYTKLLGLAGTMQTITGRAEAAARTAFMHDFLTQLGREIGAMPPRV
jgi:uncharacterized protein